MYICWQRLSGIVKGKAHQSNCNVMRSRVSPYPHSRHLIRKKFPLGKATQSQHLTEIPYYTQSRNVMPPCAQAFSETKPY